MFFPGGDRTHTTVESLFSVHVTSTTSDVDTAAVLCMRSEVDGFVIVIGVVRRSHRWLHDHEIQGGKDEAHHRASCKNTLRRVNSSHRGMG